MSKNNITHGHSTKRRKTRTYQSWLTMRERCNSPRHASYEWYGAKGISVCKRWASFECFLEDMGTVPDGMSLERKDSTKNYEPENCRWATQVEQQNNRTNNRRLTLNGETHTTAEWTRILPLTRHTIFSRLRRGWSEERALSEPRH